MEKSLSLVVAPRKPCGRRTRTAMTASRNDRMKSIDRSHRVPTSAIASPYGSYLGPLPTPRWWNGLRGRWLDAGERSCPVRWLLNGSGEQLLLPDPDRCGACKSCYE